MITEPQVPQEQVTLQEQVELEDTIINILASLWAMYDKLLILHPLDKPTFQDALHQAQAIVCARPKIRGILMARQGIAPQPASQPVSQSTNLPVTVPQVTVPINPQVDSLSDQPINKPLRMGEVAAAIPIHGTGGMKTLPGAQ